MSDLLDNALNLDGVFACTGSGFEESFTFTPFNGEARTVYGIIRRDPPATIGGGGDIHKPAATIEVANDASNGIAITEVKTGATVTFNLRKGDSSTAKTLLVNLSNDGENHDAGTLRLEV